MSEYIQDLSYTVVPVIVFMLGIAFIYREYLNHRANLLDKELTLLKAARSQSPAGGVVVQGQGSKAAESLRIQAYERLVLYLERIAPDALIMRLHQSGMSAELFRNDMTKAIREEFEHNLSQQIFVSEEAWNRVVHAREETIQLINIAHKKMNEKSSGLELSRLIFSILSEVGKKPNADALTAVLAEARQLTQPPMRTAKK